MSVGIKIKRKYGGVAYQEVNSVDEIINHLSLLPFNVEQISEIKIGKTFLSETKTKIIIQLFKNNMLPALKYHLENLEVEI